MELVQVVHPIPHDGGEEDLGDAAADRHVGVAGRRQAVGRTRDERLVHCNENFLAMESLKGPRSLPEASGGWVLA